MSVTAGTYGPEDDEFEIAGLTPAMGKLVNAPMVAESPANLECRVVTVVSIGEGVSRLVVGRVVAIHVETEALDGTRIVSGEINAIGRMAGNTYVTTKDIFELNRPD